ncbi:HTH-type transcriptional repressor GamR [Vibrio stylophorae]|uniref:HTH-type transcriptional repressor GamR n=1 Tax=Vibrio stylophorae TaxID=659351 RepID=A0ABM8ZX79_9VIBR|nr:GntR family transcriptional regulator [Vibrio stylophorae]CAH0535260.1 HTH-type transcriptional repressor GamR [Vibrio stylophorae]
MLYQHDLPLYLQIKNAILERIISGVYHDKLPGEHTLSSEFEVARGTIKQAIDTLVLDGVLIKRQGKGTFINQETVTHLHRDYPVVTVSQPNPSQLTTKLLTMMDIMADSELAQLMQMSPGMPLICLERVHYKTQEIVGYTRTYLNGLLYSGLSSYQVERGLYEQLRELFGNSPSRIIEQIEAVNVNAEIANKLGIAVDQAALCVRRMGFDRENHVAELSYNYLANSQILLQLTASQTNQDHEWWCTLK